jgi:DNA-binding FadR family transcriptional regulator
MFKTVRQFKAPQQIIQQIRSSILTDPETGDRLASETQLMEDFASASPRCAKRSGPWSISA